MEDIAQLFSFIFGLFLLFGLLIVPLILTCFNIFNLIIKAPVREDLVDKLTFLLGPAFMWLLWQMWSAPEWDVPLWTNMEPFFHTPLANSHLPTLLALSLWAWLSFWLLRFSKKPLPPLPTALCVSGIEAGIILTVLFAVQLSPHLSEGVFMPPDVAYMLLFPANYLFCSARLLRRVIAIQTERFRAAPPQGKPFLALCQRLLSNSLGWMAAGVMLALPLLALLLCVLVLFGQAPDTAIRAFTETSDWAFSQMTSPPPVEYHGHYLCTVAAGGHPRIVKPLRKGLRYDWPIIVNRQLCVANAFEQLIMERTPRLHRTVRQFYDHHGYPLSQKLTTPLRADITYLLMKPLEWFFLLCLYTFDEKPENRIATQYTGK